MESLPNLHEMSGDRFEQLKIYAMELEEQLKARDLSEIVNTIKAQTFREHDEKPELNIIKEEPITCLKVMSDSGDQPKCPISLEEYSVDKTSSDTTLSSSSGKVNPFVLQPILEVLIKYLDYKTCKSGRLVCQMWNYVLSPKMRDYSDPQESQKILNAPLNATSIQSCTEHFQPNPFMLETVLTVLMKHLEYKTLKNGRLVCRVWNEVLTSELFELTSLHLDYRTTKFGRKLENFLKVFPIPDDQGISGLLIPNALTLWNIGVALVAPSLHLLKWIHFYGPRITKFDFFWDFRYETKMCSANMLFRLLLEFPNLQEFRMPLLDFLGSWSKVQLYNDDYEEITDETVVETPPFKSITNFSFGCEAIRSFGRLSLLHSILHSMPNIKQFTFCWDDEYLDENEIERFFSKCVEGLLFENLIELNLSPVVLRPQVIRVPVIQILSEINFKCIKKLSIGTIRETHPFDLGVASLANLLTKVSSTLEELRLEGWHPNGTVAPRTTLISIPKMTSLKQLTFRDMRRSELGTISCFQKYPNLKQLFLKSKNSDPEIVRELFRLRSGDEMVPHLSLQELELCSLPIDIRSFIRLVQHFPELKSLKFRLPVYSNVISDFPYIFGSNDKCFARFMSQITNLKKLECLGIECECIDESDFNFGIAQYLAQLLELKRFSFVCKISLIRLYGDTIIHGFLKAPSLNQYLYLQNFVFESFSSFLLVEELKKKILNIHLIGCLFGDRIGDNPDPLIPIYRPHHDRAWSLKFGKYVDFENPYTFNKKQFYHEVKGDLLLQAQSSWGPTSQNAQAPEFFWHRFQDDLENDVEINLYMPPEEQEEQGNDEAFLLESEEEN